jgi:hypothetical protein
MEIHSSQILERSHSHKAPGLCVPGLKSTDIRVKFSRVSVPLIISQASLPSPDTTGPKSPYLRPLSVAPNPEIAMF